MECKFCGAPLEEGQDTCPFCGRGVNEVPETPARSEESVSEQEEIRASGEEALPEEPKKKKHGWVWAVAAVAVAAVLAVGAFWYFGKKPVQSDETAFSEVRITSGTANYSVSREAMTEDVLNTVVATCKGSGIGAMLGKADNKLDNRLLSMYYWDGFYQFYNQYYYYMYMMGLDETAMESTQYSEEQTWQEYFLSMALNGFHYQSAAYQAALAEKMALPAEYQESLDAMKEELATTADIEDQMYKIYGPGVTAKEYLHYVEINYYYNAYLDRIAENVKFTDEDISAYFDSYASEYAEAGIQKIDKNVVNVRHILICPENVEDTASWEAAKKKAEELYGTWKSGAATEDSFAELAAANTEDPGSMETGGLYEDVYPGQMVDTFDAWCFDDSRKTGDTGIVETSYGYHIMYFVSEGDYIYWRSAAEDDYVSEQVEIEFQKLRDEYKLDYDLSKIALTLPGQIGAVTADTEAIG